MSYFYSQHLPLIVVVEICRFCSEFPSNLYTHIEVLNLFFLFYSKISELKAAKTLLFVRQGLRFHETQNEIIMKFNITDGKNEISKTTKGEQIRENKSKIMILNLSHSCYLNMSLWPELGHFIFLNI